ncbi:unnamed protein product, partial [Polarella glacialis]
AAQCLGLEKLTLLRLLAGTLLALGGSIQGFESSETQKLAESERADHFTGILFMLASMCLTALKWMLIQIVTQRSPPNSCLAQMSKLQINAAVQPVTGLTCLVLALAFESAALSPDRLLSQEVLLHVLLISVGITVIQVSELKLVQLTSAVATGVLMNVHHIPMVLAGVTFFHDKVDSLAIAGFALCILGGGLYAVARSCDAPRPVLEASSEEGCTSESDKS